jgi:hypothetical protein
MADNKIYKILLLASRVLLTSEAVNTGMKKQHTNRQRCATLKLLLFGFVLGFVTYAHAQVFLQNLDNTSTNSSAVTNGLFWIQSGGSPELLEQDFSVAFYAGSSATNLSLLAMFLLSDGTADGDNIWPGTFLDPTGMARTVTGASSYAFFQIEAWLGSYTNYASAFAAGEYVAQSAIFSNSFASSGSGPPPIPPTLEGMPAIVLQESGQGGQAPQIYEGGELMSAQSGGTPVSVEGCDTCLLCSSNNYLGQRITLTREGSMLVAWCSRTNEIYRIEYTTNIDSGTWQTLYDDYPSQGTNTFWTDIGDLTLDPVVLHPQDGGKRFYRIALAGTNVPAQAPQVSILSPTNNATLNGRVIVSVTVTNTWNVDSIRLFVDGAEVGVQGGTETNFVINTCEFANGSHNIFAVVDTSTGSETTEESPNYTNSIGLSTFRSVSFSNVIQNFRVKLQFQNPEASETNRFTAGFTSSMNWALQITNDSGTAVRSVSGTGANMSFTWDGRGTGGTNLPSGKYEAVLSVAGQTNTLLRGDPWLTRPAKGTFGIAFQGNHPYGTTFGLNTRPSNGAGGYVNLNVTPGAFKRLYSPKDIARSFRLYMSHVGYRSKFLKGDSYLHAVDLRKASMGGSNIFSTVNLGILIGHGVHGTSSDFTIAGSGPLQSYYPVYEGGSGYNWVRLSEFDFGSPGTNGLRWMSILTCNNLVDPVFEDCYNKEVLPVNDYLHLLLGAKTFSYMVPGFGYHYSHALTGQGMLTMSVKDAWFYAGQQTQSQNPSISVHFRVIGWPACFGDTLESYSDPDSGNPADITFEDQQVTPW